jgi:PAS domain S-box-containing protein
MNGERQVAAGGPNGHRLLLEQAVERAPMLVFVADESMRYLAVSEYACDVLGYTRGELLGMQVTDIAIEPRSGDDYRRMVEAGWLAGISRLRCKDGEEVTMRYRAGETEIDGRSAYVAIGWVD